MWFFKIHTNFLILKTKQIPSFKSYFIAIRYATTEMVAAPYYVLDGIFWTAMYAVGGVLVAMVF